MGQTARVSGPTPRARARSQTLASIKELALAQLSTAGAGELSLRAIARELNLVSSAIYRYYASRDELITALIIDAYHDLADALEAAGVADRRGRRRRWLEVAASLRAWALAQPHRYGLIYGTPIPGYRAPRETIAPAGRVVVALVSPLAGVELPAAARAEAPTAGRRLRSQLEGTTDALGLQVDPELMRFLTTVFASLIGMVSLELGGHFVGAYDPADDLYASQVEEIANRLGI